MNLRELLPLVLFLGVCFGLARCAAFNNAPSAPKPPKVTSKIDKEARLRANVIRTAKQQLGTRYCSAGKDPRKGFDCSGFTNYVLGQHDISVSGPAASQENLGKKIPLQAAQTGDLIFFRREKKGRVFHVAIVVENGKNGIEMIHSTSSRGVVIDNLNQSSYWKPKASTARDVISG